MRTVFSILAALALITAATFTMAGNAAATAVGSAAPAFSLSDQNGKTVSLSDFAGKVVVLEWFNEHCPVVKRHYSAGDIPETANKYASQGVVWLAINSTNDSTTQSNKEAAQSWKMDRPILNDASGSIGHAYGATNTPHVFIVDKDGKLAYSGAFDNDPDGERSSGKVNLAAKALDELLAGKPVSEPHTKAYGCPVHYAK